MRFEDTLVCTCITLDDRMIDITRISKKELFRLHSYGCLTDSRLPE
jgi:hypothetical protein